MGPNGKGIELHPQEFFGEEARDDDEPSFSPVDELATAEVETIKAAKDDETLETLCKDYHFDYETKIESVKKYIERILEKKVINTDASWLVTNLLELEGEDAEKLLAMIGNDNREPARDLMRHISCDRRAKELYMKVLKAYDPEEAARWEDDGGKVTTKVKDRLTPRTPEEKQLEDLTDIYQETEGLLRDLVRLTQAGDKIVEGFAELAENM